MKRQIECVYRPVYIDASAPMQHYKKQLLDSYSHWLITFADLNYYVSGVFWAVCSWMRINEPERHVVKCPQTNVGMGKMKNTQYQCKRPDDGHRLIQQLFGSYSHNSSCCEMNWTTAVVPALLSPVHNQCRLHKRSAATQPYLI